MPHAFRKTALHSKPPSSPYEHQERCTNCFHLKNKHIDETTNAAQPCRLFKCDCKGFVSEGEKRKKLLEKYGRKNGTH